MKFSPKFRFSPEGNLFHANFLSIFYTSHLYTSFFHSFLLSIYLPFFFTLFLPICLSIFLSFFIPSFLSIFLSFFLLSVFLNLLFYFSYFLATDGLWDVMSSQAAVDYVKESLLKFEMLKNGGVGGVAKPDTSNRPPTRGTTAPYLFDSIPLLLKIKCSCNILE